MLATSLIFTGCGESDPAETDNTNETGSDLETIAAIAAGNDDFSTLVAALTAADLVDTFNGSGDFTVFAPTNA
ncbi:MAG: fasciclin domain-containing protein, partial [Deltaproteobacteria bacterium]|nr:fasciclin domain-containing protein [Deltaproteobacteria bacterium]